MALELEKFGMTVVLILMVVGHFWTCRIPAKTGFIQLETKQFLLKGDRIVKLYRGDRLVELSFRTYIHLPQCPSNPRPCLFCPYLPRWSIYFRKNIETTQIPIATAKQKLVTHLLKNLPSSRVMPDGKFLALEYKTERVIVGSMNDMTQIEFPMLPNTNSKGKPQDTYVEVWPPFQNEYWRPVTNITVEMIPRIKGPSMVPRETYLRFRSKGCRRVNWEMFEAGNVCDRSSEKFRGNPLQDILLAYPRQKYLIPKVQFLGMSVWMALDTAVRASFVKVSKVRLVKLN